MINYLKSFPLKEISLPELFVKLLEPVSVANPKEMVEVTARHEEDTYGPRREYYHLTMITVPEADSLSLTNFNNCVSDGISSFSTPTCKTKGELAEWSFRNEANHIVTSWGNGSFYSFNLAEEIWVSMGLTPRCVGQDEQRIYYDDLSIPVVGIAEGETSSSYNYVPDRNVHWKMRNDYLRKYLWQRGLLGVRAFYYEGYVQKTDEYETLMQDGFYFEKPKDGWYELQIRTTEHGVLLQVHGVVIAVTPDKCKKKDIKKLVWPGDNHPIEKILKETPHTKYIYLQDSFLNKYEQNSVYSSTPHKYYGQFLCSPGYKNQWGFTDCTRIGRNLIKVPARELYKPKPDDEILHAFSHAISEDEAKLFDFEQEHIVSKVFRFVDQLIKLGINLGMLAEAIEAPRHPPEQYTGISPSEVHHSQWDQYPIFAKLAQVVPNDMAERDFLARCKTLSEALGRIKSGPLKSILIVGGCETKTLNEFKTLKLLQALANLLGHLTDNNEPASAFTNCANHLDWNKRSKTIAPLFIVYDLRIADAHEDIKRCVDAIERIGFDRASLDGGYGLAMDYIFDKVIDSLDLFNINIIALLNH